MKDGASAKVLNTLSNLKWWKAIIVISLCLIAEIGFFNAPFWTSLGFEEPQDVTVEYGKGLEKQADGVYKVVDSNLAEITFKDIGQHVDNVYIPVAEVETSVTIKTDDFPVPRSNMASRADSALHASILVDDEAHTSGMSLPGFLIHPSVKSSQWDRLYLTGETNSLVLRFQESEGTLISFNGSPEINVCRPFIVSPIRLCIYLIIILLILSWSNIRSFAYLNTLGKKRSIVWAAGFFVAIALMFFSIYAAKPWIYSRMSIWQADFEYQSMARSLAAGHSWIDYPVSHTLNALDNPYDKDARVNQHMANSETYLFDYAFYNGKYYSYFGVLPCVLFYLPYHLLTGGDLSSWKVIALLTPFLVGFCMWLTALLFKKWNNECPVLVQAVVAVFLSLAVQPAFYLTFYPTTYSVPIALGLVLSLLALCLWCRSSFVERVIPRWALIVIGGLLIGLVLGCRPQLCAAVFLAPIFVNESISIKVNNVIKTLLSLCCVGVPALISAIPVFIWNYVRFGSISDFGATYQLTATDMNLQSDGLSKIPYAIRQGLLAPASSMDSFPFMKAITGSSQSAGGYQGFYNLEPSLGGFFFWCPMGLFVFALLSKKLRSFNRSEGLLALGCVSFILAMAPLFVDVTAAAFTQRYLCDFGYLLGIAGIAGFISVSRSWEETGRFKIYNLAVILTCISVILALWSIVMIGRYGSLIDVNPGLYVELSHLFRVI